MIVSQANWYDDDGQNTAMTVFESDHAKDFLEVCERTLSISRENLANLPLAIGCAFSAGPLERVFLFGRLDYIGSAANEAAKLQRHAWNEVCVTNEFRGLLRRDKRDIAGELELPAKGWRLRFTIA